MANEVEPHIWGAAVRATKRYFKTWRVRGSTEAAFTTIYQNYFRTGYIMGYRAGQRSGRNTEGK